MNDTQKAIIILGIIALAYIVYVKPVTYTHAWQEKQIIYLPAEKGFGAVSKGTDKPREQTVIHNKQEQRLAIEPTVLKASVVVLATIGLVLAFKTPHRGD